jgi:hypothetical protein
VRTTKEVRLRLRVVTQGLLLHHLRACGQPRILGASLGELPTLLQVTGSARPSRTPMRLLLDRKIPHVPSMCAVTPQDCLLGLGGEQAVPRHANTLTTATDIFGEVKWRSRSSLKTAAGTPQSG